MSDQYLVETKASRNMVLRKLVKALNAKGLSQRAIANQVGVSRSRVQMILRELTGYEEQFL